MRRLSTHEWRTYRELRLRALADSPDAFASTLAAEQGRPDAHWAERLASGAASPSDLPLVAELAGEPVGLAWGRIEPAEPDVAHLYQMWVAPDARRLGAGHGLLAAVVAWARRVDARCLALQVTCGNEPAVRLYAHAGFEPAGDPVPLRPGSPLRVQPMRLELRPAPA